MVDKFIVRDGIIMQVSDGKHRYPFPQGYFYTFFDPESLVDQFYKNLDRIQWIDDKKLPEIL